MIRTWRRFFCAVLFIQLCSDTIGQTRADSLLKALNATIQRAENYDAEKHSAITRLAPNPADTDKIHLYDCYLRLFNEYALYNFDSAYSYGRRMRTLAAALHDSARVAYSQIKLGFVLLSSGLFKEAADTLALANIQLLNKRQKTEYYISLARLNYNLADYAQDDNYRPKYIAKANADIDSALAYFTAGSFEYGYYNGLKAIREGNDDSAAQYFGRLLRDPGLSAHQLALVASTLSDIYIRAEQYDSAIALLATAAMSDIRTSTKETSALFYLGTLLFKQGDVRDATVYIHQSGSDARFYGSRQRLVELAAILPMIDRENLYEVESESKSILNYAVVITLLFLLLFVLTVVIIRQVRRRKMQQAEISRQNSFLQKLLTDKDNLLREKEWLWIELNHRVKNNLQIIITLLTGEVSYNRVYAMSLLHEKLYLFDQFNPIDMSVYLHELTAYLLASYGIGTRILVRFEVERIRLDVSQALPLGLIMNEAITNAIKHAFPGEMAGEIDITLSEAADGSIAMTIADNGVGLPDHFEINQKVLHGLRLIQGLCSDLDASFRIENRDGAVVSIHFLKIKVRPAFSTSPH